MGQAHWWRGPTVMTPAVSSCVCWMVRLSAHSAHGSVGSAGTWIPQRVSRICQPGNIAALTVSFPLCSALLLSTVPAFGFVHAAFVSSFTLSCNSRHLHHWLYWVVHPMFKYLTWYFNWFNSKPHEPNNNLLLSFFLLIQYRSPNFPHFSLPLGDKNYLLGSRKLSALTERAEPGHDRTVHQHWLLSSSRNMR